MHREKGGKSNTQRSGLQDERRRWPAPLTSNLSEILRGLRSSNPAELAAAAWELSEAASNHMDISSTLPFLARLVKNESITVQQNIMDAIMHHASRGGEMSYVMSAVSHCLQSNSMPLRGSALSALFHYSENGGEIGLYLKLIAERLNDLSKANQQAASDALISYACRGPEQAHNVLMALDGSHADEADAVRMICRDVLRGQLNLY